MKPTDLRGILHYVPQFRERVFLIAVDGSVVADENFGNLLLDIAVLRSLNIHIVLVHGAGHQIKLLSERLHEPISNHDGTGVTDATTLSIAITACGGSSASRRVAVGSSRSAVSMSMAGLPLV